MNGIGRRSFLTAGFSLGLLSQAKWSKAYGDDNKPRAISNSVIARRGYTDCRFGQLHYIRAVPATGVTSRPPLILLHQNPSSSVEYEALLKVMATDREVVAFDTPGNGMSDWPPRTIGYGRLCSCVR